MSTECGSARRVLLDRSAIRRIDESRLAAERHAGECPTCRAFIRECEATARLVQESLSAPAPVALRERLYDSVATARVRPPAIRHFPYVAAAVIAASVAGLFLGRNTASRPGFDATMESMVADHAVATADSRLESDSPAAIETWLTARVGYAVMVPTLSGGRLLGARTSVAAHGRAAVVEYEIDSRRVSYFILGAPAGRTRDDGVRLAASKGYSIAHWRDRGLVHAFVGTLPAGRVESLAHECIEQAQARRIAAAAGQASSVFT